MYIRAAFSRPSVNEFEKVDFPYKPHPILGGFSRSINSIFAVSGKPEV